MRERDREVFVSHAAHVALPELKLYFNETIKPGDIVHVGPTGEGKRDGFDCRVAEIREWTSLEDGTKSVSVLVWGGKGFQMTASGSVANVGRLSFKEVVPGRITKKWKREGK